MMQQITVTVGENGSAVPAPPESQIRRPVLYAGVAVFERSRPLTPRLSQHAEREQFKGACVIGPRKQRLLALGCILNLARAYDVGFAQFVGREKAPVIGLAAQCRQQLASLFALSQ